MAFDPTKPTIDQTRSDAIDSIRNNFVNLPALGGAFQRNFLTDGNGLVAQGPSVNIPNNSTYPFYVYGMCDAWKCGFANASGGSMSVTQQAGGLGRANLCLSLQGVANGSTAPCTIRCRTFVESRTALALRFATASFGCIVAHNMTGGATVDYRITISTPTAVDNFATLTQIAQSPLFPVVSALTTPNPIALLGVAMGDTSNGICIDVDAIPRTNSFSLRFFRLAEAVLCEGATLIPFPNEDFGTILARCQRFYQKSFPYATAPATGAGTNGAMTYLVTNGGVNFAAVGLRYATPMRANPTLAFFNPSTANGNWYNNNLTADSGVPSVQRPGDQSVLVVNQQVAADALNHTVSVHWTADARF